MTAITPTGNWMQLTPAQKRAQRMDWFLNPSGIKFASPAAEKNYKLRAQRIIDVYDVREPDRVPVALRLSQLPLNIYGISMHTGMYDYEKMAAVFDRFNNEYAEELETFANPMTVLPGRMLDLLEYKLYSWPGHGLPEDAEGFQYLEGEYMMADEYDDLIRNPSDFWMRVYLPRTFGTFEPLKNFDPLTDIIEIPMIPGQMAPLARPDMQASLQKLLDTGKELQKRNSAFSSFGRQGIEKGFPSPISYFCKAPFDFIGDTLRGTQGIIKDMYRQPDKLLKAMDVIAELQIQSTVARANTSRGLIASFPLHKGADGWLSQPQFNKFYWPSLKKVMDAYINEGMIVSLFAEGGFNTRLASINEFPKGAVHWLFDQTDMAQAKKSLGDKCSISGNVPASMLHTGTPAEVKDYCRKLIGDCGKGGGFILAPGSVDVKCKLENLRAMVAAAREYGVYR